MSRRDRGDRFDRRLIAPMVLGSVLNPINSSIIAVALVPIGAAFGAPATQTALLVSALYFATAIGQPLAGRLVDMFGPRGMYLIGAALTALAGVIGMLAPSLSVLIVSRAVLGLGTCAAYPAAMSLLRRESERTGAARPAGMLAALSVANQTVAVIGPTLGGVLIDVGGWRAVFAINVPLAVACFLLGWIALPRTSPEQAASPSTGASVPTAERAHPGFRGIDPLGILLFIGMLLPLMLYLMDIRLGTLWLLALGGVGGVAFVLRELRAASPFIDVRIMIGNPPLMASYLRGLLTMVVAYAMFFGFPQWLQEVRGFTATAAGLLLLPTFLTSMVLAAITGRRAAVRGKLLVGAVAQIAGCAGMLLIDEHTPVAGLVAIAVLFGIPQGLLNLANQNAVFGQAEAEHLGASAGLLRTFMYLGAILASAAIGLFFHDAVSTAGLHGLSVLMLGTAAVLLILSLADRSLRRGR